MQTRRGRKRQHEDLRAESSPEHVTVAVPNFADVNDAQDAVRPSILDLGARQFTSPSTSAPPLAPIRFETALLEDSSDEDTENSTSTQAEHTPAAPSRSASSPTAASASVPPTGPRFPNWRPGTNVRSILPCDLPPTRGDISVNVYAILTFPWQRMMNLMKKVLTHRLDLTTTCIAGCCCILDLTSLSHLCCFADHSGQNTAHLERVCFVSCGRACA